MLQISKTFGIEGRKLLTPDDDYEALRDFNESYEGQTTADEEIRLELQRLLDADAGLADRIAALPGRVFSGKEYPAPGTKAVFFCYRLPRPDYSQEKRNGDLPWTEEAGETRWYLYDFDKQTTLEEAAEIVAAIHSTKRARTMRPSRHASQVPKATAGGTPAPQEPQRVEFVDPRSTPFVPMRCRGELPHLYKDGGSYFVTFRLWDAVVPSAPPIDKKSLHKLPGEQIAKLSEPPLQLGSCVLARPELARKVQDSLRHFDQQRYLLSAWCVMPNHVHVVFTPLACHDPSDILHSWKSYTAHQANKTLGRRGTFWERESFDHLIRSLEQFEGFIHYVEHNPVEAGLCTSPDEWPNSNRGYACGAGIPPAE